MFKFLKQLFGYSEKPRTNSRPTTRLFLEQLEDRDCPAALFWNPEITGDVARIQMADFSVAENWRVDSVNGDVSTFAPGANDEAYFDGVQDISAFFYEEAKTVGEINFTADATTNLKVESGQTLNTTLKMESGTVTNNGIINLSAGQQNYWFDGNILGTGTFNVPSNNFSINTNNTNLTFTNDMVIQNGGRVYFSGPDSHTLDLVTDGSITINSGGVFQIKSNGGTTMTIDTTEWNTSHLIVNGQFIITKDIGSGTVNINQTVELVGGDATMRIEDVAVNVIPASGSSEDYSVIQNNGLVVLRTNSNENLVFEALGKGFIQYEGTFGITCLSENPLGVHSAATYGNFIFHDKVKLVSHALDRINWVHYNGSIYLSYTSELEMGVAGANFYDRIILASNADLEIDDASLSLKVYPDIENNDVYTLISSSMGIDQITGTFSSIVDNSATISFTPNYGQDFTLTAVVPD